MEKKKTKQAVLALLVGIMLLSLGNIYPIHAQESGDKVSVLGDTGEVVINSTNFPDATFRTYVKDFDEDGNDSLSQVEIDNVKTIYIVNDANLKDLKGIEYFTKLVYLNCSNTGITELDTSKNTALEELYCSFTNITELDVSNNNKALTHLNCNSTNITSLDVSSNTVLTDLNCFGTEITELDLTNNPALKSLNCSDTKIAELNLSKNTALKSLNCSDTKITSLDVSNNPNLIGLNCSSTDITMLDVRNNTELEHLDCSTTEITSLDVTNNIALIYLNCDNIKITSLDTRNNKNLNQLFCYNTGIISLNLSKNTNLMNVVIPTSPTRKVIVTDGSVSLESIDANMDTNHISNLTNATLSADKKSFENCVGGTSITYDYDCQGVNGTMTMHVSLELLNKNAFLSPLTIGNWTYGQQAKLPSTTSKYGTPHYLYSDAKNGTFASTVPTNAGTWYVKAIVEEGTTYTKLESEAVSFTISSKALSDTSITISDIKKDGDVLILKDGAITLIEGRDYTVNKKEINNTVTIIINGLGNYQGVIEKSYVKDSNTPGEEDIIDDTEDIKDNNAPNTSDTSNMMFYLTWIALSSCFVITKKKKEVK